MNRDLISILRDIPDPRIGNAKKYKLEEILTIAILAVLCDCTQFTEMELFGLERENWLRSFLELEHGIPSHDTFGDVFAAIDSKAFQEGFMEWVETVRKKINGEIVAIDGKTIKGSRGISDARKAVHVVSAWAAENGLVLGEMAIDEKSNEITAIPQLLQMLELTGCIVTIDAMGTQKTIAKEIRERKADYILPVKENQPQLYEDISLYMQTEKDSCDYAKTTEKSHGRIETRRCYCTTDINWLAQKKEWADIGGIGMIQNQVQIVNSELVREEIHYVIYSKKEMSAGELLKAKRTHWSIENNLHWVLDVEFGEDNMGMRVDNAAKNMNILRHLALNLLKCEKTYKGSINLKRKKCMLSNDYLLKVFGVATS